MFGCSFAALDAIVFRVAKEYPNTNFRTTVRSAALDLAKLSGMSFSLSWESQDLFGAVNDDLAIKYAAWSV